MKDEAKTPKAADLEADLVIEALELKRGLDRRLGAVMFLLDGCSGGGDRPLDGAIAARLAQDVISGARDDVDRFRRRLCRAERELSGDE